MTGSGQAKAGPRLAQNKSGQSITMLGSSLVGLEQSKAFDSGQTMAGSVLALADSEWMQTRP